MKMKIRNKIMVPVLVGMIMAVPFHPVRMNGSLEILFWKKRRADSPLKIRFSIVRNIRVSF